MHADSFPMYGVGRDSPGALLDMLAEVASQTLHSEKKKTESAQPMKSQAKGDSVKKKCQEPSFTSSQLLSMPATQLVKQFSVFTSDELKRQYSYTCALVPGCGQRYTSFASEGRARMSIKAHLADHLDFLKRDEAAYSTFTAVAVKHRSPKANPVSKKPKVPPQKKPAETLNKENKDTKFGKSTNYLRKILSNEMSFTEFEKQKTLGQLHTEARVLEIKKDPDGIEFQVLGDHSYFEQVKLENTNEKATRDLSEIMVNEAMEENIMLMVVESDGVHMKELPYIAQDISVHAEQNDTETIYLPDSVTWSEDVYAKNMETSVTAKPKGKAKFIGTSKEEREMALALIDHIKRKGNPGGGNLQCRICDPPRSFTAPTTLVSHYRSHAGIKPYECRICRAVFTRRHSLKYHMLIHQNQTRFTCADCGKKFRHPSHFREHRRRHTGEAPFGCEDCGQRFKTRNTYKRHLKTRHGKVLTTTGELLHLSEEDFQKVRTNPKRRSETNYTESMMDEDVTAPEAIMQFQYPECNVQGENGISEELRENYQMLSKDDGDHSVNELWNNENVTEDDESKAEDYRDYEYFQEKKTDHTKTDIAVENCGFENVGNEVEDLDYNEVKNEDDETVGDGCISMDIREGNDISNMQYSKSRATTFNENLDTQEEILYDENLSSKKFSPIEYIDCCDIKGAQEDATMYKETVEVSQDEENNYDLENVQEQTNIDYFEDNLSIDNEIEYEESVQITQDTELNIEQYDNMQITEDCDNSQNINMEGSLQSEEINRPMDQQSKVPIDSNLKAEMDFTNVEDNVTDLNNRNSCLLDNEQRLRVEGIPKTEYSNHFLLQEQSPASNNLTPRANVAVEHIVQYPTTIYESESGVAPNNVPRIFLQTNQSNNIIIQNKDFVNLLTQRIKLQRDPEQLEVQNNGNGQPKSFNLVQNGKEGTILLLASSNDLKNNFMKIDTSTGGASGMQTLPVIAVQQK
ncbi:uncharacterized protein LOC105683399 isoform X2 [Athalia rosae]|uniref:uncharacterized protein LOC105683399 isoform X2 n=1 Tax=Athalia rosae TaxID=37344 RepID=UPI0020337C2B|nr:uncharacterized protein LOC105683399 isoform X2 [Athalia rosae]